MLCTFFVTLNQIRNLNEEKYDSQQKLSYDFTALAYMDWRIAYLIGDVCIFYKNAKAQINIVVHSFNKKAWSWYNTTIFITFHLKLQKVKKIHLAAIRKMLHHKSFSTKVVMRHVSSWNRKSVTPLFLSSLKNRSFI